MSSFAAALIAMSAASVVFPEMISCHLDLQNTQFPYIITKQPETLLKLLAFAKSASVYASPTLLSCIACYYGKLYKRRGL